MYLKNVKHNLLFTKKISINLRYDIYDKANKVLKY